MASESHNKPNEHSTSELLSSAKLVAEAAQSTLRKESDKVERAKVADAAGDLLDAAGDYGKLDDQKGVGQYLDKAADYLHQYQSSTPPKDPPKSESQGEPQSGGESGLGDFAKKAGGFFNKH